jgi:hypothetical protein
VYVSVSRGHGAWAIPVLVRITDGELSVVDLADAPFAQVALDDAPEPGDGRQDVFPDGSHEDSQNVEINGHPDACPGQAADLDHHRPRVDRRHSAGRRGQ